MIASNKTKSLKIGAKLYGDANASYCNNHLSQTEIITAAENANGLVLSSVNGIGEGGAAWSQLWIGDKPRALNSNSNYSAFDGPIFVPAGVPVGGSCYSQSVTFDISYYEIPA